MARQLFGTDGVRGRAGDFLSAELALAIARAAVTHANGSRPQVLIVRDTRESGEMLESAIAAGVTAAGGDALLAGVCRRRRRRCSCGGTGWTSRR